MELYIGITVLIGFICLIIDNNANSRRTVKIATYAVAIVLALVMGLRSLTVGIDTLSYSYYYQRIGYSTDFMDIVTSAPVYSIYNKVLYTINEDPHFLLICSAIITMFGITYFICTFSKNTLFSIFLFVTLYFYFNCFNGMRQGLAMSLGLFAYALLYQRKHIPIATILFALAIGTHNSIIVLLPFVILCFRRLKTKSIKVHAIASIVISALIFFNIQNIVNAFIYIFPPYARYADLLISGEFATAGKNILLSIFFAVIVYISYTKKMQVKDENERVESSIDQAILLPALYGVELAIIFFSNYIISGRIAQHLLVFMIILMPNTSTVLQKYSLLFNFICISAGIVILLYMLSGNYAGVVPYSSFQ